MYFQIASAAIMIGLLVALYFLAKNKGKADAENQSLIKTLSAKQKYDQNVDARMERFEEKVHAFEKHIGGIDYSKLNDEQLERLHEGQALDDLPDDSDEYKVVDKKPTN